MKIYRIEDQWRRGPYCNRDHGVQFAGWNDSDRHPGPHGDGINPDTMHGTYFFGFKSLAQLAEWFDYGFRREMFRRNFSERNWMISIYEVPENTTEVANYIEGGKQIAFIRGDLKPLFRIPLIKSYGHVPNNSCLLVKDTVLSTIETINPYGEPPCLPSPTFVSNSLQATAQRILKEMETSAVF